jgi:tetratricopeptide (TPR) repeat protein
VRVAVAALALVLHLGPVHAGDEAELERGVARFVAGQFAAAIDPLTAAHAANPSDLDTQLLLGIAYYRLDDLGRARPFLLAAARAQDDETRNSAEIFLGLIAEAAGDAAEARRYYDRVASSSSSLADSGKQLLDRDRGERFAAVAVLRPGIDSNVPLQPTTAAPAPDGTIDSDLFVSGNVSVRPFARLAFVIDQSLAFRKQARLAAYDAASSVTGATWSRHGESYRVALGYHLDASLLGGALYQVGHTADAALRRTIAGRVAVALGYQLVARTLYPAAYAGYSGATHTGTARLVWTTRALELELGGVFARESTDDAALAASAPGGQLLARLRLGRSVELRTFAQLADRRYDAAALGRRDVQVRGDASLYVELSSHLGGVLGGGVLHDDSNQMDLGYTKWTAYLGLVVAASR